MQAYLLWWRPLGGELWRGYGLQIACGALLDAGNEAGHACCDPFLVVFWVPVTTVILGPDRQTEYIVYHATNMEVRQMFLDRLIWMADGPRCSGPTWTPQTIVSRGDVKELMKLGCASTMSNGSAYSF